MLFRRRTRSPFHALFLTACLASTACGVASKPAMAPNDAAPREVSSAEAAPAPSAQAAPAEPRPVAAGVPALPSVPGAPPGPHAGTAEVAVDPELDRAKRMVDIEATFRVEVMDVGVATGKLRKLAFDAGGTVANETVTANAGTNANAELTLRVPVGKADSLFSALEGLGVLRSRNVSERDVGREYYDSVLRLRNLGVTRDRLEDVLRRATEVKDILTVEAELSRVRGEIEQIEGQLRYLRDRAAYATIHVTLFVRAESPPSTPVIVTPEAKFFPGLRAGYLLDVRGNGATRGYFGGGLSLGFSRAVDLHLDGYRRLESPDGTLDAFVATLGGRFHSEFLGGGARKFLDPYLGIRGGYARFESKNEIVTGATVGIEIWKTSTVRLDLGLDALVLFGTHEGAHGTLGPSLGFDVAF